jgi:hypothetical protein
VEETGVSGENYRHVPSHQQTLSHIAELGTPRHERDSVDMFFSSPLLCFVLAIEFSDLDLYTASHDSFDSFKL